MDIKKFPFFTVYTFDVSIFFDIKENACNVFPGSQRLLKILVPQFWDDENSLLKQSRLGESLLFEMVDLHKTSLIAKVQVAQQQKLSRVSVALLSSVVTISPTFLSFHLNSC